MVRDSSIGTSDVVLEIGSGKGIITEELILIAGHVIAIELDKYWNNFLTEKFKETKNLTVIHQDFMKYNLPSHPYKVFANIPFSIEGDIIRKLIDSKNPPDDCYLVVMKELAQRLSALHKENMFSVMHKPWFEFEIVHHFKRYDFSPIPNVDAVLFRFSKRQKPLLPWKDKQTYQEFVKIGFGNGLPIFHNLQTTFSKTSVIQAFMKLSIAKNLKPTYLNVEKWVRLYKLLK